MKPDRAQADLTAEEVDRLIVQRYVEDKWGQEDIAHCFATSCRRIKRVLEREGIPLRTREETYLLRALTKFGSMDKLIAYVSAAMSDPSVPVTRIAKEAHMERITLFNFCMRHQIPYRGRE